MKARTRLAPSPTGYMHIASIRQALYCYALAKKTDGEFVLRIEDTDRNRYVEESLEEIFNVLDDYGLTPDEGPKQGGTYGPYTQSERLETYQEHAHNLVQKGAAFYCFLTSEETKALQEQFVKENKRFRSPFREQSLKESLKLIEEGKSYVIRLKAPDNETIEFTDDLQGHMKFHSDEVDDTVLLKQDGYPTYHLAVVIDDTLMKITHVFRGVEWISSIPRHVLLYRAFGWDMPKFYHLPVIKDPSGGKLSKRHGATAAREFLEMGYLPEAMNNFLMLLGWSAPIEREHGEKERETFSLDEFVELFDPKDFNKSNPIFNQNKLIWFNKQYLKNLSTSEFVAKYTNWIEKYDKDNEIQEKIHNDIDLASKLELIKERIQTLNEISGMINFFYEVPKDIDWNHKKLKNVKDKLQDLKQEINSLISSFDEDSKNWTHEEWENGMREIGDKHDVKHGDVFMVLRMAVVGSPVSPPLFESIQILGKEETTKRLR